MKHEDDGCGQQVRLNDQLGAKPECTCAAKDMAFGRCCKLGASDGAFRRMVAAYEERCGVKPGKFVGMTESELERMAYAGFSDFAAAWRIAIGDAIKAIEESQPPDTTPCDCVNAVRRKLTPNSNSTTDSVY